MIELVGGPRLAGLLAFALCWISGASHADVSATDSGRTVVLRSKGENVLTLDLLPARNLRGRRLNYPHFGVMYDFLQLELDPDGKPPASEHDRQ